MQKFIIQNTLYRVEKTYNVNDIIEIDIQAKYNQYWRNRLKDNDIKLYVEKKEKKEKKILHIQNEEIIS